MIILTFLTLLGAIITGFFFRRGGIYNPITMEDTTTESTPEAPAMPVEESTPTKPQYLWDTPQNAKHSVRVICDEMGMLPVNKDLICSVIEAESGFKNTATNKNLRLDGTVDSTDWGICQINDRFHIGKGQTFPSVDYVLNNPDKVVKWMIEMFRAGHLNWWCAYTNNSYKNYL